MSYPRVVLSATPSASRGELVAKLKFFFQEASTLSPHEFDAWFFALTIDDRAIVHDILQPLHTNWPSQVEYPNVIALVHWLREHRAEYRAERAAAVADGASEQEAEGGDENLTVEGVMKMIEQVLAAQQAEAAAAPTVPEPEPPVPEPTCPGGIDEEPQPQPIHPHPYPVDGMDVLAVLVMVLAPACLVRLLMILFLLQVLRQASNEQLTTIITNLNNTIPTMSNNNNNNTTPASDATMAERLAYYEKSCKRAEKRIEKKKALVAKLDDEHAALRKQLSEAKLAPTLDMKRIETLDEKIKENDAELEMEFERHEELCKDYQKLIDMKNLPEAEFIASITEYENAEPERDGGDGEGGEGEEKEA
ncbi:uncharacterized protein J4E79_007107 [Alternaria viburni]|uniref:uncharacterized protein n=1 Tax=Alternaria viburni TaxID=566460 RepID=UPI0020C340DE|nr:uncharacterized protein J4E79_007107 [Alternaria viburni]KAI4658126.1 hypothetical protein J4E79_007107 [Alternaria viburni]